MKINDVYVRYSVYDPDIDHDYPIEGTTFKEEDMEGFKKARTGIKEYLEELIRKIPGVNPRANAYIPTVVMTLTIHKPPMPELGTITFELDDYNTDESCMVKDSLGFTVLNLSEEYDDVTWRELNRVINRIVQVRDKVGEKYVFEA